MSSSLRRYLATRNAFAAPKMTRKPSAAPGWRCFRLESLKCQPLNSAAAAATGALRQDGQPICRGSGYFWVISGTARERAHGLDRSVEKEHLLLRFALRISRADRATCHLRAPHRRSLPACGKVESLALPSPRFNVRAVICSRRCIHHRLLISPPLGIGASPIGQPRAMDDLALEA